MTDVAVVVPWRAGDPDREAAWAFLKARYADRHPDWEVVEGSCPEGRWCKGAAVAEAAARTSAVVLVVADADVWCDGLQAAVDEVMYGHGWAVPHLMVNRLDQPTTASILAGRDTEPGLAERPYVGHVGGGIVVIAREVWDRVPLDPRFTGWGQEDDSWGLALRTLEGDPWQGFADLDHFWHRPQRRVNRAHGNARNLALFGRYREAYADPVAMAAIVDEI